MTRPHWVDHEVDKIFERLEELGAVQQLGGGRVTLTDLSSWATRRRLIESSDEAPAVGEVVDATALQLLTVCAMLDPEGAAEEVAFWCEARAGGLDELAADEQVAVVSELWRTQSPFTDRILEAIGRRHSSRDVAKAARRALFKLRSS